MLSSAFVFYAPFFRAMCVVCPMLIILCGIIVLCVLCFVCSMHAALCVVLICCSMRSHGFVCCAL